MVLSNSLNNDYRFERKFFISDIDVYQVKSLIRFHPNLFSQIFHERFVNNIYFDTENFKNYFDNIGGNMDRMKIRIRWYGDCFMFIDKPVLWK